MIEVDHLVQMGSGKVVGHGVSRISISLRFQCLLFQFLKDFGTAISAGFHRLCGICRFCRADYLMNVTTDGLSTVAILFVVTP